MSLETPLTPFLGGPGGAYFKKEELDALFKEEWGKVGPKFFFKCTTLSLRHEGILCH